MDSSDANLLELRRLVKSEGGLLPALRTYTGLSTNAMCARWGLQRSSVHIMAAHWRGRQERGTRRALEAALGLPPCGLDTILDKDGDNG